VTNGDAAVEALRGAGIVGEHLPWRDVLHDGPVPGDVDAAALRAVRARFIADAGWGSYDDVLADFARRDATLAAWRREVVLWFEHDLYDQLQLLQVLATGVASPHATLAQATDYLTALSPAALRALRDARVPVGEATRALAARAWDAFRAAEPTALAMVARSDTSALPALGPALARLLEELPSATNGLSRCEQQALEAVRDGAATVADAFRATQRREAAVFRGDASFELMLHALAGCPTPLVDRDRDRLALTGAGRAVLAGDADHVALGGVDRWLGGVRLTGRTDVWRWDAAAGRVDRR
jgi:hypothetical protein